MRTSQVFPVPERHASASTDHHRPLSTTTPSAIPLHNPYPYPYPSTSEPTPACPAGRKSPSASQSASRHCECQSQGTDGILLLDSPSVYCPVLPFIHTTVPYTIYHTHPIPSCPIPALSFCRKIIVRRTNCTCRRLPSLCPALDHCTFSSSNPFPIPTHSDFQQNIRHIVCH
jgi:hypothetical protein